MATLESYAEKYQTIRMERRDGILQITFHTNGGPLQWGEAPHREFPEAFRDIGSDPDTKVVIMTGTGDARPVGIRPSTRGAGSRGGIVRPPAGHANRRDGVRRVHRCRRTLGVYYR